MNQHGLIQIAGIIDRRESGLLVDAGVDLLGFPFRLPVHREDLTEDQAADIIKSLPAAHRGALVTYLSDANEILALANDLGARVVQLHGDLHPDQARYLHKLDPSLTIIKSLVVRSDNMTELQDVIGVFSPWVDMFITDTFDPTTGASGATGKTHDWAVSRRLVESSRRPVILAGGLRPENVAAAIRLVRPAGVDSHTGVEGLDGRKDCDLVTAFVDAARNAFQEIAGV